MHARRSQHAPHRDPYFHRIATELWDGKWETIVATRSASDRERLFIEATILCKYGKSISLRGVAEKVRDALADARARHVPLWAHVPNSHTAPMVASTAIPLTVQPP